MSGRKLAKKSSFIIILFVKFFSIFPKSILRLFYELTVNMPGLAGIGIRYVLLRNLLKHCGQNVSVSRGVILKGLKNISIGNNVSIHSMCYFDGAGGLEIKNDVSIAHACSILTANHGWDDLTLPIKYNKVTFSPVIIDSDVWIGCACRILAGVTINSRSIVAAGSVVTKNVESNVIVGGVPAKVIKTI